MKTFDKVSGKECGTVSVGIKSSDCGLWNDRWLIEKYNSREDYNAGNAYETSEIVKGNLLLVTGINEIWNLVAGASANVFNEANSLIGVGSTDTAAVDSQTDLLAASDKTYKAMSSGYPTVGTNEKIVFRAVFGEADANYNWREFVIKHDVSDICLNRLVSNQGTKASGQVWTVTLEISLS